MGRPGETGKLPAARGPWDPLVMGIVNTNPDSFSDARRLDSSDAQVRAASGLVRAGADLIDVGGESGVTYNDPTQVAVEVERVVPVISALAASGVSVSVDTWKPEVARAAVRAGAEIINDVSGLADPALAEVAAEYGVALVVMHTRAKPKTASFPNYRNGPESDVLQFIEERVAMAIDLGVSSEKIIVDPGPDFAKTPDDSVRVLRDLPRLVSLGFPVLLAVSRKYFLGAITGRAPQDRQSATIASLLFGVSQGASIVRVHDVEAAVDALRVARVLEGLEGIPAFDPEDESLKWIR